MGYSKPLPDDLADYAGKIGALDTDGQVRGYVRVRADSVRWSTGFLRRRTAPEDRLFLDIVLLKPDGSLLEWIPDGPLDEPDAREELGAGSMMIRGVPHRLTWLEGSAVDEVLAAHFD